MGPMSHVLVTGASGLVGSRVASVLSAAGHEVTGTFRAHPERLRGSGCCASAVELDLADDRSLEAAFRSAWPEAVVHCAALSDLAACESDPEKARRMNYDATLKLARMSGAFGCRFIFCSTDQVFDGEAGGYREEDVPAPIHVYGATKRDAEQELLRIHPAATVLRLSLVYGLSPSGDRSVSERIVNALSRGERLRLFVDEFRTPILADDVAQVILRILPEHEPQILHVAGPERLSRYDLGLRVAAAHGLDPAGIEAVRRDDVATTPRRPKDLSLDITRLRT
ncbi:MAG: SDR family oxidoreductase, partial [Planctomycetes bacterium]|nr:SDR family oxidoreductase [Planctomycetota bacterium]